MGQGSSVQHKVARTSRFNEPEPAARSGLLTSGLAKSSPVGGRVSRALVGRFTRAPIVVTGSRSHGSCRPLRTLHNIWKRERAAVRRDESRLVPAKRRLRFNLLVQESCDDQLHRDPRHPWFTRVHMESAPPSSISLSAGKPRDWHALPQSSACSILSESLHSAVPLCLDTVSLHLVAEPVSL